MTHNLTAIMHHHSIIQCFIAISSNTNVLLPLKICFAFTNAVRKPVEFLQLLHIFLFH